MKARVLVVGLALGWGARAYTQDAAPVDAGGVGGWRPAVGALAAPDPTGAARAHEDGLTRLRAGDLSEAVVLLRAAYAKNPTDPLLADDLGAALARTGARREAEGLFRRALALDPRRASAYANLAESMTASPERWSRRDEVVGWLEQGLAALRDDPRGRQTVALALAGFEASVGQLGEARRRTEAVLAERPALTIRQRALERQQAIEGEERSRALADWPEPPLGAEAREALTAARAVLGRGAALEALAKIDPIVTGSPTSGDARFLRAEALEALGRHDEASRELALLLQLHPAHARSWRLLGMILAQHGGALEADRADDALRRALALEPSWGDLRELRRQVAQQRSTARPAGAAPGPAAPSARAQWLFEEAQRVALETPEVAVTSLRQALVDSPAFPDAAASLFALTGEIAGATVQALWSDGPALARLAAEILRLRRDEETLHAVSPWLDRAVSLGSAEARFQRALLRSDGGDKTGALDDLAAYMTSSVAPPRLAEAQALRASLASLPLESSALARSQMLLLAERPGDAVRALGGPCRTGVPAENLMALGRVAEYEGQLRAALVCYRLVVRSPGKMPDEAAARTRLALVAARIEEGELSGLELDLLPAARDGIPAASWALARLRGSQGRWEEAADLAEQFLQLAPADDPLRAEVGRQADELRLRGREVHASRLRLWRVAGGGLVALLALAGSLLAARRLRGRGVQAALAHAPGLFPEVAAAIAELRHDVIKHRASTLGLAASDPAARGEAARVLLEPAPTSQTVVAVYERLQRAAAADGVVLRPLDREPVFGPLLATLTRAEALIIRPGQEAALGELDRDLRERHGPALAALLQAAPRTRLDPAEVAGWLRAFTGDAGTRAGRPIVPGLSLPALDVELPVTPEILHTITANLVRNAVAALQSSDDPRLLVRVEESRDAVGRRLVTFLVADSAPATISLEEIDRRDSQRGLGIVRDLVRRWGGHLVVRNEAAPFVKAIGAAFPMAGAPI